MRERSDLRVQLGWFLRGGPIWTTKLRLYLLLLPLLVAVCLWFAIAGLFAGFSEVVRAVRDTINVCNRESIHRLGERMRG